MKAHFAYEHGLAGVMTWSIDTDDFRGKCGGPTYPLLRTINNALYQQENGYYSGAQQSPRSLAFVHILGVLVAGLWGRFMML